MCEVLEISESTYYKYRHTKDPDYQDYLIIKKLFTRYKKVYGYRRITDELREEYGWIINHKKVLRIMNKYGIVAKYIKDIQPNYTKKRYEEDLQAAGEDETKKLEAIARFCRALEVLHAFPDGNQRTIAFIFLNKLLLMNGFSPTILPNPYCFDGGYMVSEIVMDIKRGMDIFRAMQRPLELC